MRIPTRIPATIALAIAVPFVFSACTANSSEPAEDAIVITVCEYQQDHRYGAVDIVTSSSGNQYFIIPSQNTLGMWPGLVYEISVEPSEDASEVIVEHRELNEKAQPCP